MSLTEAADRLAADSAELARWKARTQLPRKGCKSTFMPLGNASVWTEFELLDDRAVVLQVLINGSLVDAECWLHPRVLEAWESELWDSFKDSGRVAAGADEQWQEAA